MCAQMRLRQKRGDEIYWEQKRWDKKRWNRKQTRQNENKALGERREEKRREEKRREEKRREEKRREEKRREEKRSFEKRSRIITLHSCHYSDSFSISLITHSLKRLKRGQVQNRGTEREEAEKMAYGASTLQTNERPQGGEDSERDLRESEKMSDGGMTGWVSQ